MGVIVSVWPVQYSLVIVLASQNRLVEIDDTYQYLMWSHVLLIAVKGRSSLINQPLRKCVLLLVCFTINHAQFYWFQRLILYYVLVNHYVE